MGHDSLTFECVYTDDEKQRTQRHRLLRLASKADLRLEIFGPKLPITALQDKKQNCTVSWMFVVRQDKVRAGSSQEVFREEGLRMRSIASSCCSREAYLSKHDKNINKVHRKDVEIHLTSVPAYNVPVCMAYVIDSFLRNRFGLKCPIRVGSLIRVGNRFGLKCPIRVGSLIRVGSTRRMSAGVVSLNPKELHRSDMLVTGEAAHPRNVSAEADLTHSPKLAHLRESPTQVPYNHRRSDFAQF
ncbi:hypothetical protein RND71_025631 [Anisodus tanguticus]|uniref:Uncharacterized protein n=1 Tax=Anisodus tanguticus TaxID=243964 RepID=A0AAE1RQN3_9SOLA|nr:hypothetical protein RND71_025631 [Anisodus tanguticus]